MLGPGFGLGRSVARWRSEMPSVDRQDVGDESRICQAEYIVGSIDLDDE